MKHKSYIPYTLSCLALLLIIFLPSHQPGELSYAISDHLGELIRQFAARLSIDLPEFNIRKIAHVAIFFLLGLSAALMLSIPDLFEPPVQRFRATVPALESR